MRRLVAIVMCTSVPAAADPIVLSANALATTTAPAGLVTVTADGDTGDGVTAEALVWTGGQVVAGDNSHADVLVLAVRAHSPDGEENARIGRFVESLGALRPVQIDGAAARVLLPDRMDAEAFAGVPVIVGLTAHRAWDWIAGGRVAREVGAGGSVGIAYAEQREDGRLASEELGIDGGAALSRRDDVGAKLAYDLANPGVAEAALSASRRYRALRIEIYSSYRAASHLLPATSLFTVLGDMPAERTGTTLTWRAAPRLDVGGDIGMRYAAGDIAAELVARAKLRLDERGKSAVSCELRRDGVGDDKWTGARAAVRIALPDQLAASTELELVVPDHGRGEGTVWPWALVSLSRDDGDWQTAIAGEASASPEDRRRIDVLIEVGRRWGKP